MKKFTVLALALLLVVAFTVPASALENIFGGYWRTRFYTQKNFDGDNTGAQDLQQVDTRTRFYYTAKLNDNLKLVNKFEIDTVWGDNTTVANNNWGDIGTDGRDFQIKNSYADFKVGPVNFLVGAQTFTLLRGFISDEDGIGMKAIWKVNDGMYMPFIWQRVKEGGAGHDANEQDLDAYIFTPIFYLSKDIKINPSWAFLHARDGQLTEMGAAATTGLVDNVNLHVVGLDFDAKMGAASLWFTGIYQFGSVTTSGVGLGHPDATEIDLKAYLVAAGGKFDLGKADIHGQVFYATGEEDGYTDKEINGFMTLRSSAYYWAEIMGGGILDNQFPTANGNTFKSTNGAPCVTNMLAANIGAKFLPTDKLSITADLWYAKLAEDDVNGEDKLGFETDLLISYKLVEGLNLDIVGAYLFAGDAMGTTGGASNARDPYEFGTRLSLSF